MPAMGSDESASTRWHHASKVLATSFCDESHSTQAAGERTTAHKTSCGKRKHNSPQTCLFFRPSRKGQSAEQSSGHLYALESWLVNDRWGLPLWAPRFPILAQAIRLALDEACKF